MFLQSRIDGLALNLEVGYHLVSHVRGCKSSPGIVIVMSNVGSFFQTFQRTHGKNKWVLIDQVIVSVDNLTRTPTTRRKLVPIVILPITDIIVIGNTFDDQLRGGKTSKPHLGSFGEECCVLKKRENRCEILKGI